MSSESSYLREQERICRLVGDQAKRQLQRFEMDLERSYIENVRCVHVQDETDSDYGSQVWFFDGEGVDLQERRRVLHGGVEISVQYGLLEPGRSVLYLDNDLRYRFLKWILDGRSHSILHRKANRFWVVSSIVGVFALLLVWMLRWLGR